MKEKIFSIYSKFIDSHPDVDFISMDRFGIMFCNKSFKEDIFRYFNWFCLHCEKPSNVFVFSVGENVFVYIEFKGHELS